ncbi:hypothetical protein [Methylocystis parvus]|uniref:Uncharacterized protein n=1 Tax=Methylocystis parvus TaxID=134 RepID=A0A6B8M2S6_9HYPH|nr:hypothetical protein [Methylocystis parvus]QGM99187.1 hypothetical protein F7D14_17985 [Methylocystis parvus]WBK00434.1 hypothetical protein MMG94_01545 [Methylocystis parvus OBBP]
MLAMFIDAVHQEAPSFFRQEARPENHSVGRYGDYGDMTPIAEIIRSAKIGWRRLSRKVT